LRFSRNWGGGWEKKERFEVASRSGASAETERRKKRGGGGGDDHFREFIKNHGRKREKRRRGRPPACLLASLSRKKEEGRRNDGCSVTYLVEGGKNERGEEKGGAASAQRFLSGEEGGKLPDAANIWPNMRKGGGRKEKKGPSPCPHRSFAFAGETKRGEKEDCRSSIHLGGGGGRVETCSADSIKS